MRFQFKTSYNQDIRLFRDKVDGSWYGLLALAALVLPLLMDEYYVGETTWVFIYAVCGVSLMVLVGYTGLVSLGHAAFLGIGAYAHAYFIQHGVPWIVSIALAVSITTAWRRPRKISSSTKAAVTNRITSSAMSPSRPGWLIGGCGRSRKKPTSPRGTPRPASEASRAG